MAPQCQKQRVRRWLPVVTSCLPRPLANWARAVCRAILGMPCEDDSGLQLDAILNELRRLHVRLDALHEAKNKSPVSPAETRKQTGEAA